MKRNVLKMLGMAALASGMMLAQEAPAPNPGPGQTQKPGNHRAGNHMARMATALNLTDAQKQQAREIFHSARQQGRPVAQQLHQYRTDLAAAVKSGAPADKIDDLTAKMGPLMSQMAGIRAKAFEKFYATLTPEQQQKATQMGRFHGDGRRG